MAENDDSKNKKRKKAFLWAGIVLIAAGLGLVWLGAGTNFFERHLLRGFGYHAAHLYPAFVGFFMAAAGADLLKRAFS